MLRAASRLEEAFGETVVGVSVITILIFWGWIDPGGLPMLVHPELDFEISKVK